MGLFGQISTVVWKELYVRAIQRQGWLSLSESLLAPVLCFVFLVTTGPPFAEQFREHGESAVHVLDWPCAIGERQHIFRKVAFAPRANYTERLVIEAFREYSPQLGLVGFRDASGAVEYASSAVNDSEAFDLIIVFEGVRPTDARAPEDLRYTLVYNTSRLYLLDERDDRRGYYPLRRDYVLPVVCRLGESHVRLVAHEAQRPPPRQRWRTRSFHDATTLRTPLRRDYTSLPFALGLVWLLLNYVAHAVRDKRLRLREFRRLVGQAPCVYWFELMLRGLGPLLASCCLLQLVVTSVPDRFGVSYLHYGDPTVLMVVLYAYALHVISYMTLVSVFFTSETLAVLVASFAILLSFLPHIFFVHLSYPVRLICCLLPNTALQMAMDVILTFERDLTGVEWDQLHLMLAKDVPNLGSVLVLMLLGTVLHLVLAVVMDDLLPLSVNVDGPRMFRMFTSPKPLTPWKRAEPEHELFEPNEHRPSEIPALYVDNVSKMLNGRPVLNQVRLRVYDGEAVAVLGPNGCGKSTLAHIIAGLEAPSLGDVYVRGHSLRRAPLHARSRLGYVPHSCVLFPYMTVSENLFYFSRMCSEPVSAAVVSELLRTFFLYARRHDRIIELSHGLRKCAGLCVALMASPKVLVLDDPVAGVDALLRRRTLKLIKTIKGRCPVLFTSHNADELDFLADRVVILARGVVQCSGSPAFLKRAYGVPYRCRLVRDSAACRSSLVEAQLRECLPNARLFSKVSNELLFSLGTRKLLSFGHTFRQLNEKAPALAVRDVGFPYLSLEDVLMRVSFMSGEPLAPVSGLNPSPGVKLQLGRSGSALWRDLVAVLQYRLLHMSRHLVTYALLLLMGALLFLAFCDRVASVRVPFPRALPRTPLDPAALRHGYARHVPEMTELSEVLRERANRTGVQIVNAPNGVADVVGYENFSASVAYELGTKVLVSWFNIRSRRSEALSLLLLQNAVLEQVTGNGQYSIQAALQFLPGGASVSPANVFSWLSDVELKLSGATFVPVSLGLFTAAAAVFPSMDQAEGGRLLQRLAGVSGSLYWVSNMFWDYAVLYLLYMLLLSPMVVIWGLGDSFQFWMSVVLLFAAYGWAAIPFAYIMAGIGGQRASRSFALAIVAKCALGVLAVLYVIRMHLAYYEEEEVSRYTLEGVATVARAIPTVALAWGLGRAMWFTSLNQLCHMRNDADFMQACRILNATAMPAQRLRRYWFLVRCCNARLACVASAPCRLPRAQLLTWNPHSAYPEITSLFLTGLLCLATLCFCETNVWTLLSRIWTQHPHIYSTRSPSCLLDQEEKRRQVRYFEDKSLPCQDVLVVGHVRQEAGPYAPLHDVSFCVHRRECLALLGPTGCGRSLLLRVLSGQQPISDGNAHLVGGAADLFHYHSHFVRMLGYAGEEPCGLLSWLTGRQVLRHMARLRRVSPASVQPVVEQLLRMVDLEEAADRYVAAYSSGLRARLSLALALVGAPPVLLLDKPTAHLDPIARRRAWHCVLTFAKKTHAAVLLATDDIEEAESVGTRVLLLHRGRARRVLDDADLDPNAERGYELTVSLEGLRGLTAAAAQQEVEETMRNVFRGRQIAITRLESYVRFRVMDSGVDWELLVESLDNLRRQLGFVDYRVLTTTVLQCAFYRRLVEPAGTPSPSLPVSPASPMSPVTAAGPGGARLYTLSPPHSAFPHHYALPRKK